MSSTRAVETSSHAVWPGLMVASGTRGLLVVEILPPDLRGSVALQPVARELGGPRFRAPALRGFYRVTSCFQRVKKPSHNETFLSKCVFERVPLVVDQAQVPDRTPEMPLVHDPYERGVAGGG